MRVVDVPRRQCRGLALITAMLVVALVTASAVALTAELHVAIRRADNVFAADRARHIERELEQAAVATLREDVRGGGHDSAAESWASARLESGADRLRIRGSATLRDLDGRFNLNNLAALTRGRGTRAAVAPAIPPNAVADKDVAPRRGQDAAVSASPGAAPPVRASGAPGVDTAAATSAARTADPGQADTPPPLLVPTGTERLGEPIAGVTYFGEPAAAPRGEALAATGSAVALPSSAKSGNSGAALGGPLATPPAPANSPRNRPAPGSPRMLATDADPATAGMAVQPGAGNDTHAANAEASLELLLRALDVDTAVIQAILDWIDPDSITRYPNGAEDDYYLGLDPSYRAANRAFVDVRELRLVRGVTPALFERLAPLLSALPERTPLNVNTAPVEVLMSLGPAIDRATAEQIVHARNARPFLATHEFDALLGSLGRPTLAVPLAVSSRYFELTAQIDGERIERRAVAVLRRDGERIARIAHRLEDFQ